MDQPRKGSCSEGTVPVHCDVVTGPKDRLEMFSEDRYFWTGTIGALFALGSMVAAIAPRPEEGVCFETETDPAVS
jgi:hypothetical protein